MVHSVNCQVEYVRGHLRAFEMSLNKSSHLGIRHCTSWDVHVPAAFTSTSRLGVLCMHNS